MTERTTCGQKLKDGHIFSCVGGQTRRGDGRRSGGEMKECEPGEAEEDEERKRRRRRKRRIRQRGVLSFSFSSPSVLLDLTLSV